MTYQPPAVAEPIEIQPAVDEAAMGLRLYNPHVGQRPVHMSPARFRVVNCGRRFGKTMMGMNELAKRSWNNPGGFYWWVAPSFKQVMIAYRGITSAWRKAFRDISKAELRLEWHSGSVIEFRSTENYENLRGEGVNGVVLDESARVAKAAWEEVIRPALSDRMGWALFLSTPKGRNWFFEAWHHGQDRLRYPDWESFTRPSSARPTFSRTELAAVQALLPEDVFRQEYEAEFLEDSAGVFRNIRGCTKGQPTPGEGLIHFEAPQEGESFVIGWDVAKTQDASVVVVLNERTGRLVGFDRYLKTDYTLQVQRVALMSKLFRNARVLMDSTGVGEPVFELLRASKVAVDGYKFGPTTKQPLIEHLSVRMQEGWCSFPELRVLIGELEIYEYQITRAGNVQYSAPEGYHDDCVCALALATWAAKHGAGMGLFGLYRDQYDKVMAEKKSA